jgi:hypothetical protein
MSEMDLDCQPNMLFMGAIRKALVERGIASPTAEKVAVRLKVSLEADAFTVEQIHQMAGDYANILVKLRQGFKNQGFLRADEALVDAASQMSLTYG